MERILLIGRNGQVGWELERCLVGLGEIVALDRSQLDLREATDIRRVVREVAPTMIFNAAAFTDVERAESDEAEALAINGAAVEALARASHEARAVLVHYSTDYVFDGAAPAPYREHDTTAPLSAYGRTKLAGEEAIRASGCAHLIIRTSWVYASRGRNFLLTILRLAAQQSELRIVDDQHGAPTSARLIAQITAVMLHTLSVEPSALERVRMGTTVNVAASGETTWYGFASEMRSLAAQLKIPFGAQLIPIRTDEYPVKARRPMNSRLSLERLSGEWGILTPPWRLALRLCMEELAGSAAPDR